ESYFAAAEATLNLNLEAKWVIDTSRNLLLQLRSDFDSFRRSVDWAAKLHFLNQFREEEGITWHDPVLQAYDLEYSNIDPEAGLFYALLEMGEVLEPSFPVEIVPRSRAFARGIAIQNFNQHLTNVGWRGLTFGKEFVELRPDVAYPDSIADISDVENFITALKDIHASI
ncbi:MAG: proteasome accessory factor PafA2 family protein, partial [Armatimonadota bacterium]